MSENQVGGSHARAFGAASAAFFQPRRAPWESRTTDAIAESADEFKNRFKIRVVDNSSRRVRASSLIQRRYAWRGHSARPLRLFRNSAISTPV